VGARDRDARVLVPDELDVLCREVLTHDRSPVVTGCVMPGSIYHSHAGLLSQSPFRSETIWLRFSFVPSLGPLIDANYSNTVWVETNWPIGGQHLYKCGCPEPTIDVERFVVVSLTAAHLSITQSARGPDLPDPGSVHEVGHQIPFSLVLEGDEVHAALPAVVPGSEPVPAAIPQHLFITLPTEPISFVLEAGGSHLLLPLCTLLSHRKAHLPPVTVRVDIVARGVFRQRYGDHPPPGPGHGTAP